MSTARRAISPTARLVLLAIRTRPEITKREAIAAAIGCRRETVWRCVRQLVAAGLVQAPRGPHGRWEVLQNTRATM